MYRMAPAVLVRPRSVQALAAALRLAAEAGVPVTLRAGGSGTGGAALGGGMVLDLAQLPEAAVLEKAGDPPPADAGAQAAGEGPAVRVGAAVRHDRFQRYLRDEGYTMPADPSSGQLSLIGGNIATRASGPHALTTGAVNRYVEAMRILLADGTLVDTARPETIPPRLIEGIRDLQQRLEGSPELLRRAERLRSRKIASGYNLLGLLRDGGEFPAPRRAVEQLMCGSVGTLAVVLDVTLRGRPREDRAETLLVPAASRGAACDFALACRDRGAAAVELVDAEALAFLGTAEHPGEAGEHLLYVELRGADAAERREDLLRLAEGHRGIAAARLRAATDAAEQEELWKLRKRLLLEIRRAPAPFRPLSVVNDVGVPPEKLASFTERAVEIFRAEELTAPIYGHAGSGNLHLRPLFDTSRREIREQIRRVADRIYGEALARDGTVSGEHGMGRLRSPYLPDEWGPEGMRLFRDIRELFDPEHRLADHALFHQGDLLEHMDL